MFKRFIFLLSFSTVLCAPFCVQAATLSDSITHALQTHPQLKAGEAVRKAASKNVWEQRAGFFPSLQLDGGAGRIHNNDNTSRAFVGSEGASSYIGQGTVMLSQPIFSGFSSLNNYWGAKERYAAAGDDLRSKAEDIALQAARAHLNLMRTHDLLDEANKFLADIEARRKKIAASVKGGGADESQLLQADEMQATARNTRLGYEEAYRQAEADYIEVVGEAPDAKLEFGAQNWSALIPSTVDEAVTAAAAGSPRVLSADDVARASLRDLNAEEGSLVPHVDAVMSYTKTGQNSLVGGNVNDGSAMVKLGWNFSLGGAQFARIGKKRQQEIEAIARRDDAVRTVTHDVRQKYTSMLIVDQQYALLSDQKAASEKVYSNFLSQYEGGKQTNLQLIAARMKEFEAGTALIDAHYRQLLSRFELLGAMGKLRVAFGADKVGISRKG